MILIGERRNSNARSLGAKGRRQTCGETNTPQVNFPLKEIRSPKFILDVQDKSWTPKYKRLGVQNFFISFPRACVGMQSRRASVALKKIRFFEKIGFLSRCRSQKNPIF
jgi:hypothetical protein